MAEYTPLTEDQYKAALSAGFSHDQIVENEKQRKAESTPTVQPSMAEQYDKFGKDHPYLSGALSMIPGVGAIAPGTDEFSKGVTKKVARDVYNLVTSKAAGPLGTLADYVSKKFGVDKKVEAATAPSNPNQEAGGMAATAGELALPVPGAVSKVAEVIPTAEKAGAKFAEVMGAAHSVPININLPGDVALRYRDLKAAGGGNVKVMEDFLKRVTDPDKGPLTYQEARDFYSNATRISADEAQKLTPVMRRQVSIFTKVLGDSIGSAADQVGKLEQYQNAMNEYHNAMRIRALGEGAKKALTSEAAKIAAAAGAGAVGAYGVREALK